MIRQIFTKYCDNCHDVYKHGDESAEDLEEYSSKVGWTKRPVPNGSVWDLCPKCSNKPNAELR